MRRRQAVGRVLCLGLALLLSAAGCGGQDSQPQGPPAGGAAAPAPPSPPAEAETAAISPEEAAETFAARCSSCHGMNGSGDGPAARGLNPSPRDFRNDSWQESVSDEHIERVIAYGGAAVGKSPVMPAHPDLAAKPEMLAALRRHVRSLGN